MSGAKELHDFFHAVFPERMVNMSKHKHERECKHEVTVCEKCDIAYCSKCAKEWGASCNLQHYYFQWSPQTGGTGDYWRSPVVTSAATLGLGVNANAVHVHE